MHLNRLPHRRLMILFVSLVALLLVAYSCRFRDSLPSVSASSCRTVMARSARIRLPVFSAAPYHPDFRYHGPYLMPNFQAVDIPSHDPGITISSWFVPADTDAASAPAVIVIHGLGVGTTDCKHSPRLVAPCRDAPSGGL